MPHSSTRRPTPTPPARELLPGWAVRTLAWGVSALVAVALVWLLAAALLSLSLVAFTLAIALLLTALLWPLVARLRSWGVPRGVRRPSPCCCS